MHEPAGMNARETSPRLRVRREALRTLSTADLRQVAGATAICKPYR